MIHGWERARGAFPFAIDLLQQGISLIQLPCPEMIVLGGERPPMTYEEYAALPEYRERCRELLKPCLQQIEAYLQEGYQYLGIVGVHESPNCSITGQRGVLMEEFFSMCGEKNIQQKSLEVPTWYQEGEPGDFSKQLKKFLEET